MGKRNPERDVPKPVRPFPNPEPPTQEELDKVNRVYPPHKPLPDDHPGFPREPGSTVCAGENDELLPGNFVVHCDDTWTGGGYNYTIEVSPSTTVLQLKQKIVTPNYGGEECTRDDIVEGRKPWLPPRPRMGVDEMFLRFGKMGIVDDDATMEELGIGPALNNYCDILEI